MNLPPPFPSQATAPPGLPLSTPWLAYGCLAASMALVGSYVALSKVLLAVFPVLLLAWLRFAIAAVAMLHWLRRQPHEPRLSRHDKVLLFWESFLGNFLFSICMLYGVALTSAVAAGVIMAALPAAVAVLSRIFLGEAVRRRVAVAIGFAIAGVALLAMARGGTGATHVNPWGVLLLLGAVLCEASYVVIGKRLSGRIAPRRISALINLWGLALATPLALGMAWHFDFASVTLPLWSLLLFYAITASVITVWLWMRGLQQVPSSRAGVFTVMLPATAALIGVLFLGERFGPFHVVALVLSLTGLLLATWPDRNEAEPATA